MTPYELQVINHIFDQKNIVLITPFSGAPLSLPQYELTIASMIRSGLLIDKNTFSEKGILIAKRLKDYKAADTHISVNNYHFALLDDNTAILIYVTSTGEYELVRLQTKAKDKPDEHVTFFIDNEQIYLYEFATGFLSPLSISDFQYEFKRRFSK